MGKPQGRNERERISQCGQRASFNRDRDLADEAHWCSSVFGWRNACGLADSIDVVEIEDIISYHDVVAQEKIALQKGMNYGVGKNYSVFLMSLRENAPYADAIDEVTGMLTYEGHDEPQRAGGQNPKEIDQPLTTPRGSWTENGKFFRAALTSLARRSLGQGGYFFDFFLQFPA